LRICARTEVDSAHRQCGTDPKPSFRRPCARVSSTRPAPSYPSTFAFRHHFLPHTAVRHRLNNSWRHGQLAVRHADVPDAIDAWLA